MARYRNPRFAPEFLEKKLSPTLLVPVSAAYSTYDDPEPLPEPSPGLPPLPRPEPQTLPILPGVSTTV